MTHNNSINACARAHAFVASCIAGELPDLRGKPNQPLSFKFLKKHIWTNKACIQMCESSLIS